jgi:hypothetical protein
MFLSMMNFGMTITFFVKHWLTRTRYHHIVDATLSKLTIVMLFWISFDGSARISVGYRLECPGKRSRV